MLLVELVVASVLSNDGGQDGKQMGRAIVKWDQVVHVCPAEEMINICDSSYGDILF